MKIATWEPCEWMYRCPYCNKPMGYSDYPEEEAEQHFCNDCKKEYIVLK